MSDDHDEHVLSGLIDLSLKWSKTSEAGKGIALSAYELDLLNALGAGKTLMSAIGERQRLQAIQRRATRDADG